MVKEVAFIRCVCDKCGIEKNFDNEQILIESGWFKIDEEIFCKNCIEYYKSIKPVIGDQVICLIQDENRHLFKGQLYSVCETPYNSDRSTVSIEDKDNNSIYVSAGNGWQAKLFATQYDI